LNKVVILSAVFLLLLCSVESVRASGGLNPRLDCNSTYDPGVGALCIYSERSALAGQQTVNPVRVDLIANYIRAKDEFGGLYIDTGGIFEYLKPRLKVIHSCYLNKKINMCDVYRSD
jgi:hypothetical protein